MNNPEAKLILGDSGERMAEMPENSMDAVICDPPYALNFMGKEWDDFGGSEDTALGYYFSGLIDGEGHFRVSGNDRQCAFAIKLRADDVAILEDFQQFLGYGRMYREERGEANPMEGFIVDTKEGCAALCSMLNKYPLRAKKSHDFHIWQEAVNEWLNMPRGNRWHGKADYSRLAKLGEQIRAIRKYVDPAWSGNAYQDWCRIWATEALRVLKPGGHIVAFGGPRTYHRLACGLEDAGFIMRDCLAWIFGCLSDDTEILVEGRWVPFYEALPGRLALAWDMVRGEFSWQPIQDLFTYAYRDTAYRLGSNCTDQIVSRGHRCIVERGGEYVFRKAETLKRQEAVPILEDLQGLLESLPVPYERAGYSQENMLGTVSGGGDWRGAEEARLRRSFGDDASFMRSLWQAGLEAQGMDQEGSPAVLFNAMQRNASERGVSEAFRQGPGWLVRRIEAGVAQEDGRGQQSGVERWSHLFPQAWQLQADKVRSVSSQISIDGPLRWIRYGASPVSSNDNGTMLGSARSCASCESRSAGQQARKPDAFQEQQRTQALRSARYAVADLARIEPIHYSGIVWCIRIAGGAFVARRKGLAFVTGNSGFPKSMDVSKAADKAAGAEREVTGLGPHCGLHHRGGNDTFTDDGWKAENREGDYSLKTAPATELAKRFEGWGTSLKPAYEPIALAMKPLDGTFVQNAERWGVAGLHIDACRVSGQPPEVRARGLQDGIYGDYGGAGLIFPPSPLGRFPANLILSHTEDCRLIGTRKVGSGEETTGYGNTTVTDRLDSMERKAFGQDEIEDWECSEFCPARLLDEQSGFTQSNPHDRGRGPVRSGLTYASDEASLGMARAPYNGLADSGGASRFFYCAKAGRGERFFLCRICECQIFGRGQLPRHRHGKKVLDHICFHPTQKPLDVMRWLVRLLAPEGGLILDCFAGTGTTAVAAVYERVNCFGIDNNPEYLAIAQHRVDRAMYEEFAQGKLF